MERENERDENNNFKIDSTLTSCIWYSDVQIHKMLMKNVTNIMPLIISPKCSINLIINEFWWMFYVNFNCKCILFTGWYWYEIVCIFEAVDDISIHFSLNSIFYYFHLHTVHLSDGILCWDRKINSEYTSIHQRTANLPYK